MPRLPLTRRDSLRTIATAAVFAPAVIGTAARAGDAPLPKLPNLATNEALLLRPSDRNYERYLPAFNARTMLRPQLRALCKSPTAVSAMIDWCRTNDLPFALRSGGHSFEGLSESRGVVIDSRLMNRIDIDVDAAGGSASVGAGASLGQVYRAVAARNFAIATGVCPTTGVAGIALGGGMGYLGRAFGLHCDNLQSVELVGPQGNIIVADEQQHPDLFWANRGGGGGSFGAVTRFRFRLQPAPKVIVFGFAWTLPVRRILKLIKAWQAWAPYAPNAVKADFAVTTVGTKMVATCFGQTIGPEAELRRQIKPMLDEETPVLGEIKAASFLGAINYHGRQWSYISTYAKATSDYVTSPIGDDGLLALVENVVQSPGMTVVCEPYGGAVGAVAVGDTAFSHRGGTLYHLHLSSIWETPTETPARLQRVRELRALLRPYVSGASYVNYCDLDLPNFATAYWGPNLARLSKIKSEFDPENVFRHAQSVPVGQ